MSHFRVNRRPSPRDLRWFGLLLPFFVALVGVIARWQFGAPPVAAGIWSAGGALAALYWLVPPFRRPILVGWMYAALPIGWTVSHLIMGVMYYCVVTPIGLLSRLVRGDTLHRRPDRNMPSYWIERPHRSGTRRYLRQF
ncbi:MAG: hypothetical protein F4Y45_04475 [Acidobacteria bacterium]|nr:hypothetical protein [Acidobacteriota bacterium]MYJ06023.1 hypothetical protein [Acidobacteriota bacterium]